MGGKSETVQKVNQKTEPWAPAVPGLQTILGGLNAINPNITPTETGALNTLSTNAQAGNPYAGQIGGLASDLLGGGIDRTGIVGDAYSQFKSQLAPTAQGDFLDPNKNPWFSQVTNTIGNDVQNRLAGMYAGAGRDPSGAGSFAPNLGRGIAEGLAPVFGSIYNTERGNQMGAIRDLFGGGGQTASLLSGLDQTAFGNRQAGIGAADAALGAQNYGANQQLAVEAARRGIPISILSQLAGIAGPIAGLGNQTSGTVTGTSKLSGADQFLKIMQGLSALGAKSSSTPTIPA